MSIPDDTTLTPEDWHLITLALHVLEVQVMADMQETEASRRQTADELTQIKDVLAKVAAQRRET